MFPKKISVQYDSYHKFDVETCTDCVGQWEMCCLATFRKYSPAEKEIMI